MMIRPEKSPQDDNGSGDHKADDEPDEWDKRITQTGCAAENEKLQLCFYEKRDWRKCQIEMKAFRACWGMKKSYKNE